MSFAFTDLDPALIARFWIYFVASFGLGLFLGIIISRAFFHREKVLVAKEKEQCQETAKAFEDLRSQLDDKTRKLEQLESAVAASEKYWAVLQSEDRGKKPADVALYTAIHGKKTDDC